MGVQMFIDLYSWEGGCADGRRIGHGTLNRIPQERDQKAGSSYSNDAITKSETEIASLEQQHLAADELRMATVAILDKSVSVFHDVHQKAETSEIQIAQRYWFRCQTCKFDWPTWLKPSIMFVSLSFVTDECPNCRRKHVPAFKIEANY
jgi:hypothetical protein